MRGNRSKNTNPELLVRRALRDAGWPGYRLHWKRAAGSPDIAYPGRRLAIFVNGCYWHRCPRCALPLPERNTEFWSAKFSRNVERDAEVRGALNDLGWTVFVIWECEARENAAKAIAPVLAALAAWDSAGRADAVRP